MAKPESFDRVDIIEKVTKVFWTKGYNGTSMQDIVDATGLNRSSIYNSFGDKHSLYLDTLKHYKKQAHKHSISNIINKSPKDAIRNIFESNLLKSDSKENLNDLKVTFSNNNSKLGFNTCPVALDIKSPGLT